VYIQYAIGIYLLLVLVLLPILTLGDADEASKFLKPMPAVISFFPLYIGYHLVAHRKIPGNAFYEVDLSTVPYWVPFSLGLFLLFGGLILLYKGYFQES
jgi:uncharacterized membrane protein